MGQEPEERVKRIGLFYAIAVLCYLVPGISHATASKPNVLIILADDMGFSDAGCYGDAGVDLQLGDGAVDQRGQAEDERDCAC